MIDPPTNSVATGLVSLSPMRTSPATKVWMSPVTNTTPSMFLVRRYRSSSVRSRG